MRRLNRDRKFESGMFFNDYDYETVPEVPYSPGGHPQYNPMIVDDRIELMDDVIKELEDYWYSEDPALEDEVTRVTKRDELLFIGDIYWTLENPDIVTVVFKLSGFDGSNDRIVEKKEIEIDFEDFLGHDVEGSLVKFISKKIESLLDSVLHSGLYKEDKMRELRRDGSLKCNKKTESVEFSALERCDYILTFIEDMKKSAMDMQDYVKELRQTSWNDEDFSNYKKFIAEDKKNIESNLKDIEFCLKGI